MARSGRVWQDEGQGKVVVRGNEGMVDGGQPGCVLGSDKRNSSRILKNEVRRKYRAEY